MIPKGTPVSHSLGLSYRYAVGLTLFLARRDLPPLAGPFHSLHDSALLSQYFGHRIRTNWYGFDSNRGPDPQINRATNKYRTVEKIQTVADIDSVERHGHKISLTWVDPQLTTPIVDSAGTPYVMTHAQVGKRYNPRPLFHDVDFESFTDTEHMPFSDYAEHLLNSEPRIFEMWCQFLMPQTSFTIKHQIGAPDQYCINYQLFDRPHHGLAHYGNSTNITTASELLDPGFLTRDSIASRRWLYPRIETAIDAHYPYLHDYLDWVAPKLFDLFPVKRFPKRRPRFSECFNQISEHFDASGRVDRVRSDLLDKSWSDPHPHMDTFAFIPPWDRDFNDYAAREHPTSNYFMRFRGDHKIVGNPHEGVPTLYGDFFHPINSRPSFKYYWALSSQHFHSEQKPFAYPAYWVVDERPVLIRSMFRTTNHHRPPVQPRVEKRHDGSEVRVYDRPLDYSLETVSRCHVPQSFVPYSKSVNRVVPKVPYFVYRHARHSMFNVNNYRAPRSVLKGLGVDIRQLHPNFHFLLGGTL